MQSAAIKTLLFTSGLIALAVGLALIIAPVAFEASAGIQLEANVNLISEIRAPGGSLLLAGIVIIVGAFLPELTTTSLLLSTVVYLGYAMGRIVNIMMEGMSHATLMIVLGVEVVIGALSLYYFLQKQKKVWH